MGLYEQIAGEYDAITGESDRAAPAEAFLRELRRRWPFSCVLDVACGTGLHAVIAANMGVAVTAADISQAMLEQAKRRATAADVQWVQTPMQEIAHCVEGAFDAVICLGNSLPHLLNASELSETVGGFASLLAPKGIVVLQLLNYTRILERRERIVVVTRSGQAQYVRFYDFLDDLVQFNVLTTRWTDDRCEHSLSSALLRPYTQQDLTAALREHGLTRIECYTGMNFAPFDETQSDTLMIVAQR